MTARRELRADEDVQLRLELEEEKKAEEDYEEMLKQEAERMSVRDFQPKVGINSDSILYRWVSSAQCVSVKAIVVIVQFSVLFQYQ